MRTLRSLVVLLLLGAVVASGGDTAHATSADAPGSAIAIGNVSLCVPLQDAQNRLASAARVFFAVTQTLPQKYPLLNWSVSLVGRNSRPEDETLWDRVWDTSASVVATAQRCDGYIGPSSNYWVERLSGVMKRPFIAASEATSAVFSNKENFPVMSRVVASQEVMQHRIGELFSALGFESVNVLCDSQTQGREATQSFATAATVLGIRVESQLCLPTAGHKNGTAALELLRQMHASTRNRVVYVTATRGTATALLQEVTMARASAIAMLKNQSLPKSRRTAAEFDVEMIDSTLIVMQPHFCERAKETGKIFSDSFYAHPGSLCARFYDDQARIEAFEEQFVGKFGDASDPDRIRITARFASLIGAKPVKKWDKANFERPLATLRQTLLVDAAEGLIGAFHHHAQSVLRAAGGNTTAASSAYRVPDSKTLLTAIVEQPVFQGFSGVVEFDGGERLRDRSARSLVVEVLGSRIVDPARPNETELYTAALVRNDTLTLNVSSLQFPTDVARIIAPRGSRVAAPSSSDHDVSFRQGARSSLTARRAHTSSTTATAATSPPNAAVTHTDVRTFPLTKNSARDVVQSSTFTPIAPVPPSSSGTSNAALTIGVAVAVVAVLIGAVAVVTLLCFTVINPWLDRRSAPQDESVPFAAAFVSLRNETALQEAGAAGAQILRDVHQAVESAAQSHNCYVARSLEAHHLIVSKNPRDLLRCCAFLRKHMLEWYTSARTAAAGPILPPESGAGRNSQMDASSGLHPVLCAGVAWGLGRISKRGKQLIYAGDTLTQAAKLTDAAPPFGIFLSHRCAACLFVCQETTKSPDTVGVECGNAPSLFVLLSVNMMVEKVVDKSVIRAAGQIAYNAQSEFRNEEANTSAAMPTVVVSSSRNSSSARPHPGDPPKAGKRVLQQPSNPFVPADAPAEDMLSSSATASSGSSATSTARPHMVALNNGVDKAMADALKARQRAWAQRGDRTHGPRGILAAALSTAEGGLALRRAAVGAISLDSLLPRFVKRRVRQSMSFSGQLSSAASASELRALDITSALTEASFLLHSKSLVDSAMDAAKKHSIAVFPCGDAVLMIANGPRGATNPTRKVSIALLDTMESCSQRIMNASSSFRRPVKPPLAGPECAPFIIETVKPCPCAGLMLVTVAGGDTARTGPVAVFRDSSMRGASMLAEAGAYFSASNPTAAPGSRHRRSLECSDQVGGGGGATTSHAVFAAIDTADELPGDLETECIDVVALPKDVGGGGCTKVSPLVRISRRGENDDVEQDEEWMYDLDAMAQGSKYATANAFFFTAAALGTAWECQKSTPLGGSNSGPTTAAHGNSVNGTSRTAQDMDARASTSGFSLSGGGSDLSRPLPDLSRLRAAARALDAQATDSADGSSASLPVSLLAPVVTTVAQDPELASQNGSQPVTVRGTDNHSPSMTGADSSAPGRSGAENGNINANGTAANALHPEQFSSTSLPAALGIARRVPADSAAQGEAKEVAEHARATAMRVWDTVAS